jgi:hypothetical protein
MPINPDLLISAAILQDYLVDKLTGKPLANGIISMYHDNARTFYKNWYYQTGIPGAYTYIPLDNPLHLSSVGTIQDPNGNDVIPFYYPYSEADETISDPYYVTVYSSPRIIYNNNSDDCNSSRDENCGCDCHRSDRSRIDCDDDRHWYDRNDRFNKNNQNPDWHTEHNHNRDRDCNNHRNNNCNCQCNTPCKTLVGESILQFTRENFPFISPEGNQDNSVVTMRNYIINNVYWRNDGPQTLTTVLNKVIAPSQHDGYTNGDIRFLKNIAGAVDSIAYLPINTPIANDTPTPEYMLNMTCSALQLGETQKCIQYPISLHVRTLQNVSATVTIQAQNVSGNVNNFLDIYIYQFLGTGALSQPAPILIKRITLNNTMQKFILPVILPNFDMPSQGLVLGAGGDDALFLQVQYPLSVTFQINHTKPQIFLSNIVPNNDFDTYDQIETIINSPRTGDGRFSLNSFSPFGFLPANDGTIGNAISNASTRANIDTWPLFNLLWGFNSIFAPMFTSGSAPVARGASAIVDFSANNQIALTKSLGQTIAGATNVPSATQNWSIAVSSTTIIGVNNAAVYNTATPVVFSGTAPAGLVTGQTYYTINVSSNTIQVANTVDLAYVGTPVTFAGTGGSGTVVTAVGATGRAIGSTAASGTTQILPAETFYNIFIKL